MVQHNSNQAEGSGQNIGRDSQKRNFGAMMRLESPYGGMFHDDTNLYQSQD
jgi:hypothetical protein